MATILIIDDVEEVRDTIREMLERGGFEVQDACNGMVGLKKIQQNLPDAVVTDIFMPEMDGLEFIKQLKNIHPHLPIIAFTASENHPFLKAALKTGALFALYKPFKQVELLYAVKKVLRKK